MNGGNIDLHAWADELADKLERMPELDAKNIVEISRQIGENLSSLKVNQFRRFLDAVRKIEMDLKNSQDFATVKDKVELLRPKLAYAAGRSKEEKLKLLMKILDPAIKSVGEYNTKDAFENLLRLIESIIAYHRFYGGTN